MILDGKRILITGVVNRRSIAYAIAEGAQRAGAEVLLTSFGRVRRLTERGYLDDTAFARWWAENRAQFRPRGPYLLRQELRRKGVGSATIDETLTEQAETVDVDEQALAVVRGKLRTLHAQHLEPYVIARRLSGLLARRGYGYDTVRTVIRTLRDSGELTGDLDALDED